jgi:hypothetical protein
MTSTVKFQDFGTYVLCHFTGRFALQPLLELARDIRAYCVEHGHRRVLVDLRESQGELGALERYEHAVAMSKTRGPGLRAAMLVRPDQAFPDRFWETVTRNRGLATHVATDPDEAIRWLRADEP